MQPFPIGEIGTDLGAARVSPVAPMAARTAVEDLLPATYELLKRGATGIYNMTNPGAIDHKTILDMYKEIVDKDFHYELMSLKEMYDRYAKAKRSNCILDSRKLQSEGIHMRPIDEAIRDCIEKGFKKNA